MAIRHRLDEGMCSVMVRVPSYLIQYEIMSKLTREDIVKLARLARLDLTDEEIRHFQDELSEILQYVEQLQSVDVAGFKPISQVTGLTNVMREDVVADYGYAPEDLRRIVPRMQDGQIKVKRMIG